MCVVDTTMNQNKEEKKSKSQTQQVPSAGTSPRKDIDNVEMSESSTSSYGEYFLGGYACGL